MSSCVSLILIFTLLKTDFVPTKNTVAGFVPHTIAGEPSIFTESSLSARNQSRTERSPVRMESSGCWRCVFFMLLIWHRIGQKSSDSGHFNQVAHGLSCKEGFLLLFSNKSVLCFLPTTRSVCYIEVMHIHRP